MNSPLLSIAISFLGWQVGRHLPDWLAIRCLEGLCIRNRNWSMLAAGDVTKA
jgi:hypothetical protein